MIYDILQKIQTELKAPKGQYNSFGKYKYRSCEDILEAVKPILAKYGTSITLSDELVYIGNRYYIKATATLCSKDGDIFTTAYAREEEEKKGMDGSQITGTASSYARKYALNGLLAIDDTKDSDATNDGVASGNNMSYEAALDYTINFGKHSGKTLKEIYKTDRDYIEWLSKNEKTDEVIKTAINIIDAEIAKAKNETKVF